MTLDEFLANPDPRGATVDGRKDGVWVCIFRDGSACVDGFFTAGELTKIAAAIAERALPPVVGSEVNAGQE